MTKDKLRLIRIAWDGLRSKVHPTYGVWDSFYVGPLATDADGSGLFGTLTAQKIHWGWREIKYTIACTEEECQQEIDQIIDLLEERLVMALDKAWSYQDCACTSLEVCDEHQGDDTGFTSKRAGLIEPNFTYTVPWPDTFTEPFTITLGTPQVGSGPDLNQAGVSPPFGVQGDYNWHTTTIGSVPPQPLHETVAQGGGAVEIVEGNPF